MPIYEYRCQDCQKKFEAIVLSKNDASEIICPKCGSGNVKKEISASSYRLTSCGPTLPTSHRGSCAGKSGFS